MNKEKFEELQNAKVTICSACSSDMCEWCQVERVVNNAKANLDDSDNNDYYNRSSTNGDYSPSSPWDAPGMSVSDFI